MTVPLVSLLLTIPIYEARLVSPAKHSHSLPWPPVPDIPDTGNYNQEHTLAKIQTMMAACFASYSKTSLAQVTGQSRHHHYPG